MPTRHRVHVLIGEVPRPPGGVELIDIADETSFAPTLSYRFSHLAGDDVGEMIFALAVQIRDALKHCGTFGEGCCAPRRVSRIGARNCCGDVGRGRAREFAFDDSSGGIGYGIGHTFIVVH